MLNGPLLDSFQLSGEIRGIGVLKAASMAEAQAWIGTDPMVQVGRLVFELHAWMVAGGGSALNDKLTLRRYRSTSQLQLGSVMITLTSGHLS